MNLLKKLQFTYEKIESLSTHIRSIFILKIVNSITIYNDHNDKKIVNQTNYRFFMNISNINWNQLYVPETTCKLITETRGAATQRVPAWSWACNI